MNKQILTLVVEIDKEFTKEAAWLWAAYPKSINGVRITAYANGNVMEQKEILENLINQIEKNNLRKIADWERMTYIEDSGEEDEYYEINEMIDHAYETERKLHERFVPQDMTEEELIKTYEERRKKK